MLVALGRSDGGLTRELAQGDVAAVGDFSTGISTAGAGTLIAAAIAGGIIARTGPGAGFIDTFDSADNILKALGGNYQTPTIAGLQPSYGGGVKPGIAFRFIYQNQVAYAMTAASAASSGVILGTNVNVAASLVRVYQCTVNNATPAQVISGTTVNSSAVITGMTAAQTAVLSPGMSAYGSGVAASALILSVQSGVGITLTSNATASATVSLTFTPTITIVGLFSTTA